MRAVDFHDRPSPRCGVCRFDCVRFRKLQIAATPGAPFRHVRNIVEPGAPQSRQVAFELRAHFCVRNDALQTIGAPPVRPRRQTPIFSRKGIDEAKELGVDRRNLAVRRWHACIEEDQQRCVGALRERRQQQTRGAVRDQDRSIEIAHAIFGQSCRPIAPGCRGGRCRYAASPPATFECRGRRQE